MKNTLRWLEVAGACALAFPLSAQGSVWIVDSAGGPGAYSTTISGIMGIAAEGDVILVREGDYDEIVQVYGKSLTIQGDPLVPGGEKPRVRGLSVARLGAGQSLTFRGFDFDDFEPFIGPPYTSPTPRLLDLFRNDGAVRLEELGIEETCVVAEQAVRIVDSSAVSLSRCDLQVFSDASFAPYVELVDSVVDVFDSDWTPVAATPPWLGSLGSLGREGVLVDGSNLGFYESTVQGGEAPVLSCGHGCEYGIGGTGIRIVNGGSVETQDATVLGGGAGYGGTPGSAWAGVTAFNRKQLTSDARTHRASSPVREGQSVAIDLYGNPSDQVWIHFGLPSSALRSPQFDVPFLLRAPLSRVALGALPATGSLSVSFPIGELGPGVAGVVVHAQAVFVDSGGQGIVLSEPTEVALLDQAF